jgi:hypothetical protein
MQGSSPVDEDDSPDSDPVDSLPLVEPESEVEPSPVDSVASVAALVPVESSPWVVSELVGGTPVVVSSIVVEPSASAPIVVVVWVVEGDEVIVVSVL